MDRKILASEIEKEIKAAKTVTAAEKKKWKDLDWSAQHDAILELQEKYKIGYYRSDDNTSPKINLERDKTVSFEINWSSIGAVDFKEVKKFIGQLNNSMEILKKAANELKKEYPDVVIKGLD